MRPAFRDSEYIHVVCHSYPRDFANVTIGGILDTVGKRANVVGFYHGSHGCGVGNLYAQSPLGSCGMGR